VAGVLDTKTDVVLLRELDGRNDIVDARSIENVGGCAVLRDGSTGFDGGGGGVVAGEVAVVASDAVPARRKKKGAGQSRSKGREGKDTDALEVQEHHSRLLHPPERVGRLSRRSDRSAERLDELASDGLVQRRPDVRLRPAGM
jgi:hypothetical protein